METESTEILAQLATARAALVRTTDGLTDEQAATRPTVSELCLGGLLKHVASMEESWLRFAVQGPDGMRHDLPEGVTWADLAAGTAREVPQWMIDHGAAFRMQPGETLAGIVERYREVAARTEEVVTGLDLNTSHPLPSAPWHEAGAVRSVRAVLLHLIHETAQHAGHADILRESLDGRKAGWGRR